MPAPLLAALAIAWALNALPFQVAGDPAPGADDADATAVRAADARVRWYAALDAAHWDRDAPSARAAADAITNELLPAVGRDEARALVAEIGADALGPWLRAQTSPPATLLHAYLLGHDDPALFARLVAAQGSSTGVEEACEIARAHRPSAAVVLAQQFASIHSSYLRSVACGAALELPGTARLDVARAVVATWRAEATEDLSPQCVALGALVLDGRTHIASWLRRAERPSLTSAFRVPPMWIGVALLALAASEQSALVRTMLHRLLVEHPTLNERLYYWAQLSEPMGLLVGWLPLDAPASRSMLDSVATVMFPDQRWFALARLRAGDTDVVDQAREALRSPNQDGAVLPDAIGLVGVAGGTTPAHVADARAGLASLGALLRAQGHPYPSRQEIDAWIAAIDAVSACGGRQPCLVGLLAHGSDDAAARAVRVLGARGLARLRPDDAQPLLRRLLIGPSPWLVAAFAITVRGCPTALRGARAAREGDDSPGVAPFLRAFQRECASSAR